MLSSLPPIAEVTARRIRLIFLAFIILVVIFIVSFIGEFRLSFQDDASTTVRAPITPNSSPEGAHMDFKDSHAHTTLVKNALPDFSSTKMAQKLKEVKGLLPENVIVMIASTGNNNGKYFRDRIIPSARTWMRYLPHVFVIVEGLF